MPKWTNGKIRGPNSMFVMRRSVSEEEHPIPIPNFGCSTKVPITTYDTMEYGPHIVFIPVGVKELIITMADNRIIFRFLYMNIKGLANEYVLERDYDNKYNNVYMYTMNHISSNAVPIWDYSGRGNLDGYDEMGKLFAKRSVAVFQQVIYESKLNSLYTDFKITL